MAKPKKLPAKQEIITPPRGVRGMIRRHKSLAMSVAVLTVLIVVGAVGGYILYARHSQALLREREQRQKQELERTATSATTDQTIDEFIEKVGDQVPSPEDNLPRTGPP